jgi:hypothetical protein
VATTGSLCGKTKRSSSGNSNTNLVIYFSDQPFAVLITFLLINVPLGVFNGIVADVSAFIYQITLF